MPFCRNCGSEVKDDAGFCNACGAQRTPSGPATCPSAPPPAQPRYVSSPAGANPAIICPQCQQRGYVRAAETKQKKGISGGKATAALLTAGLSLYATGLSRKERHQVFHCSYCGSTWTL